MPDAKFEPKQPNQQRVRILTAERGDAFDWVRREHAQCLKQTLCGLGYQAEICGAPVEMSVSDKHWGKDWGADWVHALDANLGAAKKLNDRVSINEVFEQASWVPKGIDVAEWNPVTDVWLDQHYGALTVERKEALQMKLLGERFTGKPVIAGLLNDWGDPSASAHRYVEQFEKAGFQLVLGSGESEDACRQLRHQYMALADAWLHGGALSYDGHCAKVAMRYGCIPLLIGRKPDWFLDVRVDALGGVGVCAENHEDSSLIDALQSTLGSSDLRAFQSNLMDVDVSWDRCTELYRIQYAQMLNGGSRDKIAN